MLFSCRLLLSIVAEDQVASRVVQLASSAHLYLAGMSIWRQALFVERGNSATYLPMHAHRNLIERLKSGELVELQNVFTMLLSMKVGCGKISVMRAFPAEDGAVCSCCMQKKKERNFNPISCIWHKDKCLGRP